jgi:hypothetical protein
LGPKWLKIESQIIFVNNNLHYGPKYDIFWKTLYKVVVFFGGFSIKKSCRLFTLKLGTEAAKQPFKF